MNELALFAGAGGGILGGHLLGWRTVCAVEWDAYAASVLVQRQNDGCFSAPGFPIWADVQTFDGRRWRGRVDVISGGFPCTDISSAGKGAGIDGKQSGMWAHMARIVGEVRPEYVFVENSPMLVGRGLARVLGDLAALGYDAKWGVLGAHHVAAPHKRDRIWIVANSNGNYLRNKSRGSSRTKGEDQAKLADNGAKKFMADSHGGNAQTGCKRQRKICYGHQEERASDNAASRGETPRAEDVADTSVQRGTAGIPGKERRDKGKPSELEQGSNRSGGRQGGPWLRTREWPVESNLDRGIPDGLARRVDINGTTPREGISRVGKNIPHRGDRLKCIGNGQVPQVAALAWETLIKHD